MSADGASSPRPGGWLHHLRRLARDNAYLVFVAAAGLVILRVVDFSPPDKVRADTGAQVDMVGEADEQAFSEELGNPQAVQIRATLRLFDGVDAGDHDLGRPDPEVDARARRLSAPVVTTILGMHANVEQTVRLERGALEVDVSVQATPRPLEPGEALSRGDRLSLEQRVRVHSRRKGWWPGSRGAVERVHVDLRGVALDPTRQAQRLVFRVDEHLFALDLELHRP